MYEDQMPYQITTYRMKAPKLEVLVPDLSGQGPASIPVMQRWNAEIQTQARELVRQQGYPQNPQTESTGYYELKTNERRVLSLSQFNYAYTGGAHGITLQKSLTFDGKTGQSVTLGQLFKAGSDYTARLSALVQEQIKRRGLTLLSDFPGVRPDQDFYLADKTLVLYYQLYEIMAYAFGFPYFPVSVYDVADLVAEDGAFGRMMY